MYHWLKQFPVSLIAPTATMVVYGFVWLYAPVTWLLCFDPRCRCACVTCRCCRRSTRCWRRCLPPSTLHSSTRRVAGPWRKTCWENSSRSADDDSHISSWWWWSHIVNWWWWSHIVSWWYHASAFIQWCSNCLVCSQIWFNTHQQPVDFNCMSKRVSSDLIVLISTVYTETKVSWWPKHSNRPAS